jgi:hypothetical protein
MKLLIKLFLTCSLIFTQRLVAAEITNLALFYRCFSHITQNYPDPASTEIAAVKAGQDPITACLTIFDTAKFNDTKNVLINTDDPAAKAVLRTMHNLHYSWFDNNFAPEIDNQNITNTMNIFDTSAPASFMTKALFDNSTPYSSIVTGSTTYRPLREFDNLEYAPYNAIAKANYTFPDAIFAGAGEIFGFEVIVKDTMEFSFDNDQPPTGVDIRTGSITFNTHFGGGVLGVQPYLLQTVQANTLSIRPDRQVDGGVNTHRKWSRSVFHDVLCRELPVVREYDGADFVNLESSIAFRNSQSCVKCHTSMDRLSGVVRGVAYTQRAGNFFNPGHSAFIEQKLITEPALEIFPTEPDPLYGVRPTRGRLFYRTHNGTLVDQAIANIEDLGTKLKAQDDMYNCLAKRYYQFFTGIEADIGDIADPDHGTLSAEAVVVRNIVLALGQNLKTHQNPRTLIEEILRRPEYKKSNYNVGGFE